MSFSAKKVVVEEEDAALVVVVVENIKRKEGEQRRIENKVEYCEFLE